MQNNPSILSRESLEDRLRKAGIATEITPEAGVLITFLEQEYRRELDEHRRQAAREKVEIQREAFQKLTEHDQNLRRQMSELELTLTRQFDQQLAELDQRTNELLEEVAQKLTKEFQVQLDHKTDYINYLHRMIFGQKRERFISPNNQLDLPLKVDPIAILEFKEQFEAARAKARRRPDRSNHKGRVKLPDNLPVVEDLLHPDGDLQTMNCVGTEVSEQLEFEPARLYIRRTIRYKYADPKHPERGVLIAPMPDRPMDRCIAAPSLISGILVDKYIDHIPLNRQVKRYARSGVTIPSSTIEGWAKQGMEKIELVYNHIRMDIVSKGYLQVDETPIRVLESAKKGATHKGWYWVYHDPLDRMVLFDYHPSRGREAPNALLADFKGYLQSDGYNVYENLVTDRNKDTVTHVVHVGCWAHARRKFDMALNNDPERADWMLSRIQRLYAVERLARMGKLTPQARKHLRVNLALPILNQMSKWLIEQCMQVLPKSSIGKAIAYCVNRWDQLTAYLMDGHLNIDNNPVERTLRDVAIGRKNFLFAGSHQAAQRAAMMYTLLGICKLHDVEPFAWFKYVLENIDSTKYNEVRNLYPQNFKK
jgi:transposase